MDLAQVVAAAGRSGQPATTFWQGVVTYWAPPTGVIVTVGGAEVHGIPWLASAEAHITTGSVVALLWLPAVSNYLILGPLVVPTDNA